MVVIYRLPALSLFIARHMVKLNYFSLANLLLEKSVAGDSGLRVKELLQEDVNPGNIMSELVRINEDPGYRADLVMQLKRVRGLFSGLRASRDVARAAKGLMGSDKG
jgi:lipid A disaccharide synthetase